MNINFIVLNLNGRVRWIVQKLTFVCQYVFYSLYQGKSQQCSLEIAHFWQRYGYEDRAISCYQNLALNSSHEKLAQQALIDIYTDRNYWHEALQIRLINLELQELNRDNVAYTIQSYHQTVIQAAVLTAQTHLHSVITKVKKNTHTFDVTQTSIQYDNDLFAIALSLLSLGEQDAAFNALLCAIEKHPDKSWDKIAYVFFQICQKYRSLPNGNRKQESDNLLDYPWNSRLYQCLRRLWEQQPDQQARQLNYAEILLRIGQRKKAQYLCRQAAKTSLVQSYPTIYHSGEPLNNILPSFAVIGTMKSGSTSLYKYLLQHHHILPLARKELDYWSWRYMRGSNWFLSHFPPVPASQRFIAGDASPTYFQHELAPRRMLETYPDFKVIVVLRNPVDRTISHHYHNARRASDLRPLDVAITQQIEAITNNSYDSQRLDNSVASSLYLPHLKRWRHYFSPDRLLLILSDDLFAYPQRILNQVFQFLGIQDQEIPDLSPHNVGIYPSQDCEQRQRLKNFFYPSICELEKLLDLRTSWY